MTIFFYLFKIIFMSILKTHFNEDLGLTFNEEEHLYTMDGVIYPSVSHKIKDFYEEFNVEKQSFEYALKHNLKQEDVKQKWAEAGFKASTQGTSVHNSLEVIANDLIAAEGTEYINKLKGGMAFLSSLPNNIRIIDTELRMVSKQYKYAGTSDLLLYNTDTQRYIIADYKTNKKDKLFKSFKNKKLKKPFTKLIASSYNKYQIQLSLYQIMLEDVGLDVYERWIVWLNPEETNNFRIFKTEDYTNILRKYYDNK